MPRTLTTSSTGRHSTRAQSKVLPERSFGERPSSRPMTPSQTAASAPCTAARHWARTPASPIIQVSRLQAGRPVARAWKVGSM